MTGYRPMLLTAAALAAPLLLASAMPSQGASLRQVTTMASEFVRLSDLFDDAGPEAGRVLGNAPAPGTRMVIEASQLGAIARQFGVAWRPSSTSDRTVLDRPGRLLPREEVMSALRRALDDAGAPPGELEVAGYLAPLVAAASHPQVLFEQLDYDAPSGRFSGVLEVAGDDMAVLRMQLSGTLSEMVELPVLVRRLIPGSVIGAGDVQMARVRAGLARGEVARAPEQAIGLAVRRMSLAGQPLLLADLARPPTIQKGGRVRMQLQVAGLALAAQGLALAAGGVGDRIQVLNPSSGAVVEADVLGPEEVRVATDGAPPVTAEARVRQSAGLYAVAGRATP